MSTDLKAINSKDLLSNRDVVKEIRRHLWIESEKAGCDIGFEKAAEDWVNRFSAAWMAYHMPEQTLNQKEATKRKPRVKRRRARSYLKNL